MVSEEGRRRRRTARYRYARRASGGAAASEEGDDGGRWGKGPPPRRSSVFRVTLVRRGGISVPAVVGHGDGGPGPGGDAVAAATVTARIGWQEKILDPVEAVARIGNGAGESSREKGGRGEGEGGERARYRSYYDGR